MQNGGQCGCAMDFSTICVYRVIRRAADSSHLDNVKQVVAYLVGRQEQESAQQPKRRINTFFFFPILQLNVSRLSVFLFVF